MNVSRRLLFASAFWEVARPRTALNAGHLLIRLTNPATAFDLRSAADWLHCHTIARQALANPGCQPLHRGVCAPVAPHRGGHRRTGGGILHPHLPLVRALGRRAGHPRRTAAPSHPAPGAGHSGRAQRVRRRPPHRPALAGCGSRGRARPAGGRHPPGTHCCVAPEPGTGGPEVHAMGRSAGESLNPMQEFLDLPKVSQALL